MKKPTAEFIGTFTLVLFGCGAAVIAGNQAAEDRMLERIGDPSATRTREEALQTALSAW